MGGMWSLGTTGAVHATTRSPASGPDVPRPEHGRGTVWCNGLASLAESIRAETGVADALTGSDPRMPPGPSGGPCATGAASVPELRVNPVTPRGLSAPAVAHVRRSLRSAGTDPTEGAPADAFDAAS